MVEIDDYNGDYFFEGADELEEYHSILDSMEYHEPTTEEKDYAYNIMIMEQCLSCLNELGSKDVDLAVAAQSCIYELKKFINIYTEGDKYVH